MSKDKTRHLQYVALPYRRRADASIEIMLITSRDTGRWLIPKGWPEPGLGAGEAAAHEFEGLDCAAMGHQATSRGLPGR
jgi:8-oxo-dGTP pyrophosphatase MutT (NUDIX family)